MYKLTEKQELKFEKLLLKYQDKVKLALYKCNISANNYDHFYSHAVEGFLQAFLILDSGEISEGDFPSFVFTTMKRKIIDELRRVSRNREIATDIEENYSSFSHSEEGIDKFIFYNSLEAGLNNKEKRIFRLLNKGYSYKEVTNLERVSKSYYYNVMARLRGKSVDILYK